MCLQPWCFIGKRRLDAAIAEFKKTHADVEFSVKWLPFMLSPELPQEGVDKRERYRERFGEKRMEAMIPHMTQVGRDCGIEFSYGGTIANTMDSHRIVEWAHDQGKQNEVVEAIFKRYFEREKSPADREMLLDAVKEAGLDPVEAADVLDSGRYHAEVKKELAANYERRVTGVPHFIFDGKFPVSGAQDVDTLSDLLEMLYEKK